MLCVEPGLRELNFCHPGPTAQPEGPGDRNSIPEGRVRHIAQLSDGLNAIIAFYSILLNFRERSVFITGRAEDLKRGFPL